MSTSRRHSVLRWALYGKQYETCECLIHAVQTQATDQYLSAIVIQETKHVIFFSKVGFLRPPLRATVAVRLPLEAGAQPNLCHPSGERKGSPLNCATRNATDILLLKSPLDFGADVDANGNDGKTGLIHAARIDNARFAMLLLEYGANINSVSTNGSTPLTTAIIYNSHNVLRLSLDRWHEYSICPRMKGPNLLLIAALYADPTTLQILAATDHFRRKYDKQYILGDFENHLKQRPDFTEKFGIGI